MRWMRERDALIAQTLAFVQSVTGRKEASGEPLLPLVRETPEPEAAPQELPPDPLVTPLPDPPATTTGRTIVANEVRREFDARIASFRAHQERFNREREEYFSTTLAKLRAAIRDGSSPRGQR
jgi:hypothetical protein